MTDIADKIYAATGLTLNAEAAAKIGQMIQQARRDALEKCISICNAVAHANRVEYPAKWKDRPEGIPHDWQQAWETCAETAEDIAATIRALGEKE
jgi:hypothetical protein